MSDWMPLIPWFLIIILLSMIFFLLFLYIRKRKLLLSFKRRNEELDQSLLHMEEMLIQLRTERHDMIKHFLVMEEMAKGSREMLQQYAGEVGNALRWMNQTIRGEKNHLAALLSHLLHQAEQTSIEVKLDLEAPLSRMPLSMAEQIRLVGNLLENALKAADAYRRFHEKGDIAVYSSIRSGLYLLEIENKTPPIPGEVIDRLFKQPLDLRQGDEIHGLGTYIVAQLIREHDGSLQFYYQPPLFTVKIKLPMIVQE